MCQAQQVLLRKLTVPRRSPRRDNQALICLTIGTVTLCLQIVLRQLYYAERVVLHNDVTQSSRLASSRTAFRNLLRQKNCCVGIKCFAGLLKVCRSRVAHQTLARKLTKQGTVVRK